MHLDLIMVRGYLLWLDWVVIQSNTPLHRHGFEQIVLWDSWSYDRIRGRGSNHGI